MIVSWNELQRTCQKAFRGLGIPAGVDDESSFAVLWLLARGLDALTPLGASLASLEHVRPRPLRLGGDDDGFEVLDAGGQPAVSVVSDALDFTVASARERAARVEILLTGVDGGIFVAGALAQRPASGCRGMVEWCDSATRRGLDVASHGACRLSVAPLDGADSTGELRGDAVRIAIDATHQRRWPERGRIWRTDVDEAELERRAMHSVTHGIDVPEALWTRLLGFAKRTLVPATPASRESGAGGGEYND